VKFRSPMIDTQSLGRWSWMVGILFLIGLLLPAPVQFPANAVLLAAAGLLLAARVWAVRRSWFAGAVKMGPILAILTAGWVLLDLALHRCQSNRPLEWLALLTGLALFWLARFASGPDAGRWPVRYLGALLALAAAEGLLGVLQVLWPAGLPPGLCSSYSARACGTFSNPNQYAGLMAAAIPLAGLLALSQIGRTRTFLRRACPAAAGAAVLAGLLASGSRGALAGLLVGLAITGAVFIAARRRLVLAAAAGLVLLGLAGGGLLLIRDGLRPTAPPAAGPAENGRNGFVQTLRSLGRGGRIWADPTARGRLEAVRACGRMWRDHPWIGVGPGNYTRFASDYLPNPINPVFFETGAHSLPFQWLAELGVLGGLLWPAAFGLMVVVLYRRLRRAPRGSPEVLAAVCLSWAFFAVWLHNLVDITVVYLPLKYVFPFLAALAAARPPPRPE
jgi:hypothetical protein